MNVHDIHAGSKPTLTTDGDNARGLAAQSPGGGGGHGGNGGRGGVSLSTTGVSQGDVTVTVGGGGGSGGGARPVERWTWTREQRAVQVPRIG